MLPVLLFGIPVLVANAFELVVLGVAGPNPNMVEVNPVVVGVNPGNPVVVGPLLCMDTPTVGAAFPVLAGVESCFLLSCVTPTATPTTTPTTTNATTIMIAIPFVVRYHGVDCDLVTSFE